MNTLIRCENLVKIYKVIDLEVVALQGLDLTVKTGELLAIIGVSGSGKSTLLNILGGLDRPSAGRITVNGQNLLKMTDRELDSYRRNDVGFVWQQTGRNLIPYLTARENIELPMNAAGMSLKEKHSWSQELLEMVDLWEHRQHRLVQLSGGQQQRVAIALALANKPKLLLGDEPTGEVDTKTSGQILSIFRQMSSQYDLTTIIVTHDPQITRVVDRVVTIRDGRMSTEAVRRVADVEAAMAKGAEPVSQPGQESPEPFLDEYIVVDAAGRLQVPPDMREKSGIHNRVQLEATEEGILIRPAAGPHESPSIPAGLSQDELPEPRRRGLRRWFRRNSS